MDPCTTKEASSLYGLCPKLCWKFIALQQLYGILLRCLVSQVSTGMGDISEEAHIQQVQNSFQTGLIMSVVTLTGSQSL